MGWPSFLEDIERRIDDAVPRLHFQRREDKQPNLSVEGLQKTNALLRELNDDFMRFVYALKDEISSRKQTDFCKDECIRLKKENFKVRRTLKEFQEEFGQYIPSSISKPTNGVRVKKADTAPLHIIEAKERFHKAREMVEIKKAELEQLKEAKNLAQQQYECLVHSDKKLK